MRAPSLRDVHFIPFDARLHPVVWILCPLCVRCGVGRMCGTGLPCAAPPPVGDGLGLGDRVGRAAIGSSRVVPGVFRALVGPQGCLRIFRSAPNKRETLVCRWSWTRPSVVPDVGCMQTTSMSSHVATALRVPPNTVPLRGQGLVMDGGGGLKCAYAVVG